MVGGRERFLHDIVTASVPEALHGEFLGWPPPSRAFLPALGVLIQAAQSRSTLLLEGPPGSGKSWAAQMAHRLSPWKDGPLLEISCPHLSNELAESELFGHEKGAFTGASDRKYGKVELARGGTIVFEEIGEASERLQAKLLRLFDGRRFERVGGLETLMADVRFIAATNRNLAQMVRRGQFREDLYHRLNVVSIRMPTLAQRKAEIPGLVSCFVRTLAGELGRGVPAIEPTLLEVLGRYSWPGNLRELRHALERMLVLGREGRLSIEDLPPSLLEAVRQPAGAEIRPVGRQPAALEIEQCLAEAAGNRSRAARALGVHRSRLYRLLRQYGMK